MSMDSLSITWEKAIRRHLLNGVNDSIFMLQGERIITKKNGGRYNLLPSVSPDGENLIFLSERDLFDLDLFLADANTGKVKSKIYSSTYSDKIDAINRITSYNVCYTKLLRSILGKFLNEVILRKFLPVHFNSSKICRNLKRRHNWRTIQLKVFYFISNFNSVL